MPKMKTKSGAKKRFKMTASGRVKAGVAIKPFELGKGEERLSFVPDAKQLPIMIRLARTGAPATAAAAAAMNADEQASSDYRPFLFVDQIPKDTAMLYLTSGDVAAAAEFLAKSLAVRQ